MEVISSFSRRFSHYNMQNPVQEIRIRTKQITERTVLFPTRGPLVIIRPTLIFSTFSPLLWPQEKRRDKSSALIRQMCGAQFMIRPSNDGQLIVYKEDGLKDRLPACEMAMFDGMSP